MNSMKLTELIKQSAIAAIFEESMAAHFPNRNASPLDLPLKEAEESPFPLKQWLETSDVFEKWLSSCGLSFPLENRINDIAYSNAVGSELASLAQLPAREAEILEKHKHEGVEAT